MSKLYKSIRGKSIDMDKVKIANETVAAVGNMRVNARGDVLGAGNNVAAGRNQVMDRVYAVESAPAFSPTDPQVFNNQQALMEATAKQMTELVNNLTVTKPQENEVPAADVATPAARGSLASSVAATVGVTQKPLPKPSETKKSNGPSRI